MWFFQVCSAQSSSRQEKRNGSNVVTSVKSNEIESGSNYEVENTSSAKNTVTQKLLLDGCMTTNGEEVRSCSVQRCQASSQEKGIELQLYCIYVLLMQE